MNRAGLPGGKKCTFTQFFSFKEMRDASRKRSTRFYLGRAAGGDHDHRHLDFVVVAGRQRRPRGGAAGTVLEQLEADRLGRAELRVGAKKLPTGGEGNGAGTLSSKTAFADHSVLVYLLPYIEQQDVFDQINLGHYYRMADNVNACARNIPTFVCPSNPFVNYQDTDGLDTVMDTDSVYGGSASTTLLKTAGRYWGTSDYFATVYTSISDGSNPANPKIGVDDKTHYRADGALGVDHTAKMFCAPVDGGEGGFFKSATSVPISAISDGTSNTICFIEDAGRVNPHACPASSPYLGTPSHYSAPTTNPDGTSVAVVDAGLPRDTIANPSGNEPTAVWRWADEDACGSGVSGPANASAVGIPSSYFDTAGDYIGPVINQTQVSDWRSGHRHRQNGR